MTTLLRHLHDLVFVLQNYSSKSASFVNQTTSHRSTQRLFHIYERWAWIPQIIAIFVLVGSAGPKFDTSIVSSGSSQTIAGNRLFFFSLSLSASVAWAPAGADFNVYFPPTTSKWKTFLMTFLGAGLALT
jgi:purine-cytosine permease-like protein